MRLARLTVVGRFRNSPSASRAAMAVWLEVPDHHPIFRSIWRFHPTENRQLSTKSRTRCPVKRSTWNSDGAKYQPANPERPPGPPPAVPLTENFQPDGNFPSEMFSAGKFSGNFRCSDVARFVAFFPMIPPCIAKEIRRKICRALSRNSGSGLGGFTARCAPIPCASGSGLASLSARPWPSFRGTEGVGAESTLIQIEGYACVRGRLP